MEIEKSAHLIYQTLAQLRGDLNRFLGDFQVLGTHLANAKTRFDDAEKRLVKFSDRLELAAGENPAELSEGKKPDCA
jgi:DNA recombination protein RmuC